MEKVIEKTSDEKISSIEEIEKKFSIKYISNLQPSSKRVLEKVKKRAARKYFSLVNRKHNVWMNKLYFQDIKENREAPFFLQKVNPLVGYGVFARKSIPYLSYIGEYAGDLRRRSRKDKGNDYVFGYMVSSFGTPWIIDAEKRGNFTRFLNHSFNPNVSSRGVVVDGVYRVIFFANRQIRPSEQITYDYGPTYWNKRSYPQDL
jgi:uncharacterized protein